MCLFSPAGPSPLGTSFLGDNGSDAIFVWLFLSRPRWPLQLKRLLWNGPGIQTEKQVVSPALQQNPSLQGKENEWCGSVSTK